MQEVEHIPLGFKRRFIAHAVQFIAYKLHVEQVASHILQMKLLFDVF